MNERTAAARRERRRAATARRARWRATQIRQRETQLLKRRNELDGLLGSSTRRLESRLQSGQRRRRPLGMLYFIVFGVSLFFLALAWWLSSIPYVWLGYWGFTALLALFVLLIPAVLSESDTARMLAIRAATASGNADIAPLASDQPQPLIDSQPQQTRWLGPLMRTAKRRDADWNLNQTSYFTGGIALFACVLAVVQAVSAWPNIGKSLLTWFGVPFWLSFGYVSLSPLLFHLYYRKRPPRGDILMLTQVGITWQRSGTSESVQWETIRSICVEQSRLANFGRRIFIIDADSAVFAWTIAPDASNAELAASDDALRLIMARTGLPLCDISEVVEQLLQDDRPQGRWRWQIRAPIAYAASVLLTVLLIAAGISALLTQQPAYQAHLANILAQPPLFADSMTENNRLWPVDITYGSAVYANGSYVLTNIQTSSLYELRPQTYGDVTLAVTERLYSNDDYGQAGLVLRADPAANTFLTWGITSEGKWWLESGAPDDRQAIDIVSSSAIRTANGASNKLVAIMRGNAYTFFINGHFVGSYLIASLTSGRVGVFLDILAQSSAFNDFAVYRTPPLSWNNWLFLA